MKYIIEIHRLLTAYLADLYYLTIDPFYEPQLFEIFKQQEQPALQPFVESLREFQVEQRTAYYQELARIEAEHSARQQEAERIRQQQLITSKADFNKLDQLLNAEKWKEADQETEKLMLKCADVEKADDLNIDICRNFPPEVLRIIDQLWLKYSHNRFGFSIQKKIWLDSGGKFDRNYDSDSYNMQKLADRVGWRKRGNWLEYSEYTFSANALPGHLPAGDGFICTIFWITVEIW